MPILESEFVRAGREAAGRNRKLHLNNTPAAEEFRGRGKAGRGEVQYDFLLIEQDSEIALD